MIPSTTSLALFSAILGAVSAVPPPQPGRFTVNQTRNANFRRHGPAQVAKTYLKYGRPVPAELAVTLGMTNSKRSHGSVATDPQQYDSEWLTPVQIGTPAQTLNLDFDSGSSDLWVFSTDTSSRYVNGQTQYSPSKSSSSSKLQNARWSISYGDGSSSSGIVYTDVVNIGGLSVSKQAVESAQTVSTSFTQESDLDGLLGLSFSSLNTVTPTQQKTWFDNIKGSLDSPVFAVDFKAGGVPGSYDFGYIDSSKYTGSIAYTSVSTRQGFWEFTSTGYAVGSGSFKSTSIDGIADTGTTLLYVPSSVVSAYYSQVSGAKNDRSAGGYTFPCSASLPDFTFGIGSARIVIPGEYINYAPYTGNTCFGGIQSSSGIGINIFGDVALKAAYVVFDSNGPRLGWASKSL
ncbi:secreted aspartic proteinase precursor [Xylaria bambusicola]|uniref:secreted aspartic proteinase precursor n=1 Tax=Xylaria bambusicola TaxID=326684 RepID=UPI002008C26B|nr:secreted aspartic proteinase precursor [Xylaria bambusicola]KAI0505372.1 secreted aspartic proteinase precursor [Xylaria bambusicola]